MASRRMSIRFSERIWMILNELSEKTGVTVSVIVRSLVMKGIDEITDESGNLKIDERQIQEK
ncbi:ribbon-helix-helix domain-containing protein [Bacteroides uniformis]|uniref:ribbon-helix-helix domain-containing protein n=1 Tax=Bacteroides uniformis TaxID=820 RepID=UPI00232F51AA|nr:ribbon-helix-helix domain-containing protein [Bacteroides uniformis]MDC1820816.1 ribbon-helix-helix domain-containing protein [Bacteroides uniformis]